MGVHQHEYGTTRGCLGREGAIVSSDPASLSPSPLPARRERRQAADREKRPRPMEPAPTTRRERTRHQKVRHSEAVYRVLFLATALVVGADLVIGGLHVLPFRLFP